MQPLNDQEQVPVIGIKNFQMNQSLEKTGVLFNEIMGKNHIERPHKHDFFMIILFDQASGSHQIDTVDYVIGHQEVHILFPGQIHQWHIQEGSIGYQLMIERVFFEQFAPYFRFSFSNYQNHPIIPLSDHAYSLLLYEFKAIRDELKATKTLNHLIGARAAVIATIVSREAEELFDEYRVYQSNPRLANFNMLIDNYYKTEKSVAFYAEALHLSANYLNILCKKHLYVSATTLIQQRITLEAKRLLANDELSIKYIAWELGFSDQAHFTNFFKNQTGSTPTAFRRKE